MSEVISLEAPTTKREFIVVADENGISEMRFTNDVPFAVKVYLGIGNAIAANLRSSETGAAPTLQEFLRDLGTMITPGVPEREAN